MNAFARVSSLFQCLLRQQAFHTTKARQFLVVAGLALASAGVTDAATTVAFSDTAPTVGANDIANLTGAAVASENVSSADSAYIADDQAIVGQTFTTGANPLGYELKSVTIRHVTYDTYALVPSLTYTIRVTKPSDGTLSVIASETAFVSAGEPGNIQTISGGNNLGPGSGTHMTVTFAAPVVLTPDTIYGYDIGGGSTRHYWESDGTSSDAYEGGTAYSSGAAGQGNTVFTAETGDRLFVLALTPVGTTVPPEITAQPKPVAFMLGRPRALPPTRAAVRVELPMAERRQQHPGRREYLRCDYQCLDREQRGRCRCGRLLVSGDE
jgi:hypothetical protein